MKFCVKCENMYYIKLNEDDENSDEDSNKDRTSSNWIIRCY